MQYISWQFPKARGRNTLDKQTANPESPREKRFLRLYRNTSKDTCTHTHIHTLLTVAFILGLRPLATFLNVCLSSLKTGATAGVDSSQQAFHRPLLSAVIFYYLIKKQEIRFPLSEKELILLSQSNLSWEREMESGGENGRTRVSRWMRVINGLIVASCQKSPSFFLFFSLFDTVYLTNSIMKRLWKHVRAWVRDQLFLFFSDSSLPFLPSVSSFHIVLHRARATIISLFMKAFVFGPLATHRSILSMFLTPSLTTKPFIFQTTECVWRVKSSSLASSFSFRLWKATDTIQIELTNLSCGHTTSGVT